MGMNLNKKIQKKWFTDRIGKTIYRDAVDCKCKICEEVGRNGVLIRDKLHAIYLYDISGELGVGYRDKNN